MEFRIFGRMSRIHPWALSGEVKLVKGKAMEQLFVKKISEVSLIPAEDKSHR